MLGREWKQFQASKAQSRSKRRSTASAARTTQSLSALIPGHNRSLVSGLDIPSSHSQAGRDVLEKHDIIISDRPLQINHLRSAFFRRVLSRRQDGRRNTPLLSEARSQVRLPFLRRVTFTPRVCQVLRVNNLLFKQETCRCFFFHPRNRKRKTLFSLDSNEKLGNICK